VPGRSFWVEALDERGCPVATHAGHLYDWQDTNLEQELTSLRAFFRDPAPHLANGDSIIVEAPSAQRIRGRVMGGGAVWVRPDHRGNGLATLVPRVSRAYALTRWDIVGSWAVMEPRIRDQGLARRQRQAGEPALSLGSAEGPILHAPARGTAKREDC
jgi:hypothetical protein